MLSKISANQFQHSAASLSQCVFLCLLILIVQTSTLSHSHQGEVQSTVDCELCFKKKSNDYVVLFSESEAVLLLSGGSYSISLAFIFSLETPSQSARSPPIHT
jgi:hypothetical protein